MSQSFLPFDSPLFLSPDDIYERVDENTLPQFAEDRRLERKPASIHPRELSAYFSMWANTVPDGGLIVVGISNEGVITGVSSMGQQRINDLEKTGTDFCPDARFRSKRLPVTLRNGQSDCVLVFRIQYRHDKVVKDVSGHAYVRVGDSKRRLSQSEISEMEVNKGQVDFEREAVSLKYPEEFDTALIQQFVAGVVAKKALSGDHSQEEILEQRRLGRRTGGGFVPNVACALLFATDPVATFPGCKVRFLRFDGEQEGTGERFNAVKDQWLEGPVPHLIAQAEQVLDSQLRTFSRLGPDGKFYTAPEYPKPAWYEAIVNACVHRSYVLRNMSIAIKMFDDRLVIESPGGFPPFVTPENIYDVHHPRNPHLMDAMYYLEFVKAANEGTRRIRDTMSEMSLPKPEFQQKQFEDTMVRVTLRNNIKQRKVWVDKDASALIGANIMRGLNENQKRAINFAAENGSIGVSQLQRLTGLSWPACKKILKELSARGILEHKVRRALDRDPKARYFLKK
jgi:ATP-dependent DNA helicase RecG